MSIMVSCLWHMSAFLLFGFTLGKRVPRLERAPISFLGQILPAIDISGQRLPRLSGIDTLLSQKTALQPLKPADDIFVSSPLQIKPSSPLTISKERVRALQYAVDPMAVDKNRESVLMLYPRLPMHFSLYFKDRQNVHLELLFKISGSGGTSPLFMKRRVSSGNLEVDLLAMRYIGHYLFIQQNHFTKDGWQTVKIDLSAKNN